MTSMFGLRIQDREGHGLHEVGVRYEVRHEKRGVRP